MKIRFEIDIEKIINDSYMDTRDPWALDEENKLKPVLVKNPLGSLQIMMVTGYYGSGENRAANLQYIPLPYGTKIIEENPTDKEPVSNEKLFDHIEDCYDKLSREIDILSSKVEKMDDVSVIPTNQFITEKTFLEALRILSNTKMLE